MRHAGPSVDGTRYNTPFERALKNQGERLLVEVTQRLEDVDDGHREYVLWDLTHTECWQYHEDDLESCFWATGLYNKEPKPVMDDRIREVWERVRCE